MNRSALAVGLAVLAVGLGFWMVRASGDGGMQASHEQQPVAAPAPPDDAPPAPAQSTTERQVVEAGVVDSKPVESLADGVPMPDELQWLTSYLQRAGITFDDSVRLPDARAWEDLEALYARESAVVTEAWRAHHELAKKLAREKLAAGDFTRYPGTTRLVGPGDPEYEEFEARTKKRHEDEWITTVSRAVDGTLVFDVARILPGEKPELDLALRELRDREARRAAALREFLAARKPADGGRR